MRNLSLGAILSVLLFIAVLLWGPLSKPALAQPGITFGFAVDGSGLIVSSELGEEVGRYLEKQLLLPVKVRSFTTEDHLCQWLTQFREVDIAWLSRDFLESAPAGELHLLSQNFDHFSGLFRGSIVASQGLNPVLAQQVRDAFLGMQENTVGRELLSKLEVSCFVSPSLWHVPSLDGLTVAPLESGRALSSEEENVIDAGASEQQTQTTQTTPGQAAVTVETVKKIETPPPEDLPGQAVLQKQTLPQDDATPLSQADAPMTSPLSMVEKGNEGASASTKMAQDEQIALVADSLAYNSEEDSYEAKGDVILRQAGVELRAEELLWQSATQDAAAKGSVSLIDAGTEVSGEQLQYNLATGQGQVRDGRVFIHKDNFHLSGEQIEKYGPSEYSAKQGSFTTCDGEVPDWKFSSSEVDVTLGGYARAKNVWFHIKDVPVLYTPYLMFPVKTERESGLLAPSFSYSKRKGMGISTAWYQVVDRHMDATVYLDYFSEIALGKGLEYRYALQGENAGKALYYNVTGTGEIEELEMKEDFPDLDYYRWEHSGRLPGGWRLMADVEYTDRKLFFEEFGKVAEDYNRDKTVSTLMLRRNWQKINLAGYARYIKDLEDDSLEPLQRLPELGLGIARYRLGGTPFYAGLESYGTRFWRDKGEDGDRLYFKPSLSAVFKPGSWLEIVPEVALHERLYSAESEDGEAFVPEFSLTLATRLMKSFETNLWGMDRVQHSIEPKMAYTYVPNEFQDDLPLFDLYDRIERQNDIAYAIVNRFVARSTQADGSSAYREVLNLRLSQSYDIDEERHDRSGENQPFSDVRVELDLQPTKQVSIDVDSRIPVYGNTRFRTLSIGTSLSDNKDNAITVQYAYKGDDFAPVATDYIKVRLDTSVLKPVYARFEERYDVQKSRELEKVIGLEYRAKCWSLLMTYRDRYQEDGSDGQEFMLTFVLAGLGQDQGFGSDF